MNNEDMTKLLGLLGNMNKKDLEKAVMQANQIMQSDNKDQIIEELKKKLK